MTAATAFRPPERRRARASGDWRLRGPAQHARLSTPWTSVQQIMIIVYVECGYVRPSPSPHDRLARSDDLAVQVQQDRDVFLVHPAHAAFGADTPGAAAAWAGRQSGVDEPHLVIGGAGFLIGRVVRHEREIELGARVCGQS